MDVERDRPKSTRYSGLLETGFDNCKGSMAYIRLHDAEAGFANHG